MATDNYQRCALRALNLCDGQVLEEPDGALTTCPHKLLSEEQLYEVHDLARLVLSDSLDAVEPPLF